MVKITNETGDFKRGVQGHCVYQGHYGKQIRRLLSPKSCEATKPQSARRVLFQQALSWRKTLSKESRLYLDGYAIYHKIVNDDGVVLTWDRFALKLALEKPDVLIEA